MVATQIRTEKVQQSRVQSVDWNNLPFGKIFSDHMFVSDYRNGEWTDDRIVPFGHFTMHPASMVLHYGQTIFEGMKASKLADGTPVLLSPLDHAKRLNASARRLMMAEFPEERFVEAVSQLVALDQDWIPPAEGSALYLRPFMFATDEFIGVRPSDSYRFCIFTAPVGPYYAKPVRLVVEQEYIRAVPGGTGEAKAGGNYAASLLPAYLAQQKGFDQVVWMGGPKQTQIQEVGTMNIFFVIDGEVVTPATDGAILKGITRKNFIAILRDKGYQVTERVVEIDEIVAAHDAGKLEEMFGAGTAAVVSHVAELQYKDKLMVLPDVAERKIGPMLKKHIDGLRTGAVEDKFNWLVRV
ncbi:branched-chain amino acid aminotransferase [Neolewinella lacunae]|uniref:Branched-chain-amino-acid aminotransferase n=1 Tax=Neolewinella lacunae TaxID=1517758 RepID=A0A923PID9_9BACT|nr:branched-chain amino acid aminotransferase [Neolewinella lacunae]MBC6993261.1 branched-chain amino acid aminotransferase [Neolewinella lacunae]MDN3635692.1 branched-chain amino acid aminotransferase [Neolewinella lacunae]